MFEFQEKIKFVHVDTTYVKVLHEACAEVFYMTSNYDNKPSVGVLLSENGHKYVIPLTSAKAKHKTWKNVARDRMLIYEMVDWHGLEANDIWVKVDNTDVVKHILSAIDVKKMIPVTDSVISYVDINYKITDDAKEKSYKDLLNKEYSFCLKNKDTIVKMASRIYDNQKKTGKPETFCCDFNKLESIAGSYQKI